MNEAELRFAMATDRGGAEGLMLMHQRYVVTPNPEDIYQFHSPNHPPRISRRAVRILGAIQEVAPELISTQAIPLTRFSANRHDTRINYTVKSTVEGGFEKLEMVRDIGVNELISALEALAFMDRINEQAPAQVFTQYDKDVVRQSILATVPGYDDDLGTVIQPNFKEGSYLVTVAVALADLGSAGMNPEGLAKDGDELFREEQIDIFRALRSDEPLPEGYKEFARERMIRWSESQPRFGKGRQKRTHEDIAWLDEPIRRAILRQFPSFDDSISLTTQIAASRVRMSFGELVRDFGYASDNRSHLINPKHLLLAA